MKNRENNKNSNPPFIPLGRPLQKFPSPLRGEGQGEGEKRYGDHFPSPRSSPSEGRGRLRFVTLIRGKEGDFCLHPVPLAKRAASRQGFTLIEILVAIAILAVVLSTIYVSYISTMRIVRSLEYGDEIYYMARITLERMVLDLQSSCKERDSYEFVTQKDPTGKFPLKGVSFLSRAHLDFSGPGDSMAVAQISYELEGDPDSGGFSIIRRDVLRQGEGSSGGEGYILCRRLQFVNLRFYDASGREYPQWDSRTGSEGQRNNVPSSILIELNFINPDDGANPYKFMTRLLLTGSTKT